MHPLLLLALVAGENWAEFRGPGGQGHSAAKRVPLKWSATENVAWKKSLPGLGWSSPVVVNGKVYLTTAASAGRDHSLRVLCLDAEKGDVLWNEEVFKKPVGRAHAKNSHASPTPIVAGERVYAHFGHLGTACLDLKGKLIWKNDKLAWAPVHGNGGSPALADGLLVFSRDGLSVRELVALDASDGSVKWQTRRSGAPFKRFSFSTPLVIEVGGAKQVISPGSDMVGGYDLKTGKEIWRVTYDGYSVIPRPVYAHGLVFISTGYDSPTVMAIRPTGKGDVTKTHVAWAASRNAPHTPSLIVVGGELYMVSDKGFASCLDAKKGTVHWARRLPGNGFSASPVLADGKLYFLSEDGVTTVIKPGTRYEQLARNNLGERTLATPAPVDGGLFIRTRDHLYRIGK